MDPTLPHDPIFSPPPSARELALASDDELGALYHALTGTPHMDLMRRLVRAAYEGVHLADQQDVTMTAALDLLRETQRRAPDPDWARRRDGLLNAVAAARREQQQKLGVLLAGRPATNPSQDRSG